MEQKQESLTDINKFLIRNEMYNFCKSGIATKSKDPKGDIVFTFKEKKKWGLCQWDHTVGQPVPTGESTKEGDLKYTTSTTWKILVAVEIVLLLLGDFNPVFWFDPLVNGILDAALVIFGFFMFGPIALIGLIELIPEFVYPSMFNFVEIIPIHLIVVLIAVGIRRGRISGLKDQLAKRWRIADQNQDNLYKSCGNQKTFYSTVYAEWEGTGIAGKTICRPLVSRRDFKRKLN